LAHELLGVVRLILHAQSAEKKYVFFSSILFATGLRM